ncbi:hypothetical protein UVI_02037620 [Ustilaginoidea virens]|uniref:Uncharacterized protein n=1 Tax=Ustilaginoidea virens TaxID=1159556 RepID=A0A1B5KVW5_USTVR|nr:hypothetical protein UVI_02037620 [Ustilaginoidea virens]
MVATDLDLMVIDGKECQALSETTCPTGLAPWAYINKSK